MSMPELQRVAASTLFQTDLFRNSPWIQGLCAEVGDVWVTSEASWGAHGHFTTFFGVLVLRSWYKDPVFHDLYVLHELWHRKTLSYQPGRPWLDWSRDLIASEFDSSITSECLVYFQLPELRERTFKHEIWVDRFLPGGAHALTSARVFSNPMRVVETSIRKERLRALNTPDHDDFLEHQIWNYGHQNMLWCRVWAGPVGIGHNPNGPAFRVVDEWMSRPDWRDDLPKWLESVSGQGESPYYAIPFPEQASAFQPIYERSLRDFGNDVLSR